MSKKYLERLEKINKEIKENEKERDNNKLMDDSVRSSINQEIGRLRNKMINIINATIKHKNSFVDFEDVIGEQYFVIDFKGIKIKVNCYDFYVDVFDNSFVIYTSNTVAGDIRINVEIQKREYKNDWSKQKI